MFHVTRCPNCHTSFRVTDTHLSAYGGKVRCGRCAFVFDAQEHFIGETPPPPAPTPAPQADVSSAGSHSTETAPHKESAKHDAADDFYGIDSVVSQIGAAAQVEHDEKDSLASRSLHQLAEALGSEETATHTKTEAAAEPDHYIVSTAAFVEPPHVDAKAAEAEPKPVKPAPSSYDTVLLGHHDPSSIEVEEDMSAEAFAVWANLHATEAQQIVQQSIAAQNAATSGADTAHTIEAEHHAQPDAHDQSGSYRPILTAEDEKLLRVPGGPSPWRWLWSIPAFLAVIALAGQIAYRYRTELSVQLPGIKPRLERFCALTGCKLELPARSEFMRTEWIEVKPVPDHPNLLQVDAVLRNQANFDQALPLMELTLTDDSERIVAKKVFDARTYIAPLADGSIAPLPASIPANGELRVFVQLDTGTLRSSGYSVNWFYTLPN